MNLEEETINPIINFLHKLLGNNLWILPIAIAIASWCVFYLYQDKWIVLYIAIICSLISILYIFSRIFIWIKDIITKHKMKIEEREAFVMRAKQAQAENERQNREHAASIWKLVGHLDIDLIKAATVFLTLKIHDEDKYVRFIKIPKDHGSEEYKLYDLLFGIIGKLTFQGNYGTPFKLINEERIKDIMYFHIDSYFFSLIENFKSTGNWIKL